MNLQSAKVAARLRLLLLIGTVVSLPACGGGGTVGSNAAASGLMLKNNVLTFSGQQNTHLIVGYRLLPMGGGDPIESGPLGIEPGATVYQEVPSGSYNLQVTYDDGRGERLQIPPDQVDAPAESMREVVFLH